MRVSKLRANFHSRLNCSILFNICSIILQRNMCAGDSIAKVGQSVLEKNIYSFSSASPQPQVLRNTLFLSKVKSLLTRCGETHKHPVLH